MTSSPQCETREALWEALGLIDLCAGVQEAEGPARDGSWLCLSQGMGLHLHPTVQKLEEHGVCACHVSSEHPGHWHWPWRKHTCVHRPFPRSPPPSFPPYLPDSAPCPTPWVGFSCCLFSTEKAEGGEGWGTLSRYPWMLNLILLVWRRALSGLLDQHLETGLSCCFACLLFHCWGPVMSTAL